MMTPDTKTIRVATNLHIIAARAEVRTLARMMGFDTMDQARISLATSTLAHMLDMGGNHDGLISFGPLDDGQNHALQVVCTAYCGENAPHEGRNGQPQKRDLQKLRVMVDELRVESLPTNDVQVVLIKRRTN